MSDFQYDSLMHELEALEAQFPELATEDSPARKVGSDLDSGFRKYPQVPAQVSHAVFGQHLFH